AADGTLGWVVRGLSSSVTYFVAVSAYTGTGIESALSDELPLGTPDPCTLDSCTSPTLCTFGPLPDGAACGAQAASGCGSTCLAGSCLGAAQRGFTLTRLKVKRSKTQLRAVASPAPGGRQWAIHQLLTLRSTRQRPPDCPARRRGHDARPGRPRRGQVRRQPGREGREARAPAGQHRAGPGQQPHIEDPWRQYAREAATRRTAARRVAPERDGPPAGRRRVPLRSAPRLPGAAAGLVLPLRRSACAHRNALDVVLAEGSFP